MKKKLLGFSAVIMLALAALAGPLVNPRGTATGGLFTNGIVVWSSPCTLYDVYVYNPTATNEFVMVFENTPGNTNSSWNVTNTPAFATNGSLPRLGPWPVGAGQWLDKDYSFYGMALDNCAICISTTSNKFTSAVTNAFQVQAIFDNTTQ